MTDDMRPAVPPATDLEFGDLVAALWVYRFLIAGVALASAVLALLVSLWLPKQYESMTTLLVVPSKVPNATGEQAAQAASQAQFYVQAFAELLGSREIAAGVVTTLGLEKAFGLDDETFARRLTVSTVAGTPMLRLSVALPDAGMAANAVNAQAQEAIKRAERMMSADLTGTRNYLASQVEDARRDLGEQAARLSEARARLGVDSVKKQLDDVLAQRGEVDAEAGRAARDVAEHTAHAASLKASIATQPRVLVLKRSVGLDPSSMLDASAAATGRSRLEASTLSMDVEEMNPVIEEAEPLMVVTRAKEASSRAKEQYLRQQLTRITGRITRLQGELATRSAQLAPIERDYLLAQTAYETFSKSFENARLSVAAQAPTLQVLESAQPSAGPTSPRPVLNAIAAGAVSALFTTLAVVLAIYVRRERASDRR